MYVANFVVPILHTCNWGVSVGGWGMFNPFYHDLICIFQATNGGFLVGSFLQDPLNEFY